MIQAESKNKAFTNDQLVAFLFAVASVLFIILMAMNNTFFEWAFARHQNILSWYIRPIFMIPICYFAFKRRASGISITIFLLLISMFWFPQPNYIDSNVKEFLAMEREYLTGSWTAQKIAVTSIVPLSMGILVWVLWKRKIKAGVIAVIGIAIGKIIWSVLEGGTSGAKVIVPALLGLGICLIAIIWWYKKMYQKH